jgi:hypothetical protein
LTHFAKRESAAPLAAYFCSKSISTRSGVFTMKKTVVVLSLLATSAASAGQSTDMPPDFCRGAGDDISQHVIFSSDDHGLARGRVECRDGVGGVVGTIDYALTRAGRMEAEATFPTPAAARGELATLGERIEELCKENDGRFEIEQNLQSLDLVAVRCFTPDARDYRIEAKMDGAASVKILARDANKPASLAGINAFNR